MKKTIENPDTKNEQVEISNSINIKGFELWYKSPPLKGDIYRFRCWKDNYKYFVRIDKDNLIKLINKNFQIDYIEVNAHANHPKNEKQNIAHDIVKKAKDIEDLAVKIIKINLNQPLDFHIIN